MSLYMQRRNVERSQESTMRSGEKWEVISIDWYTKWKTYVDIDYDASPREELNPGPIDNSALQGKYEDELRPGLFEDADFVLVRKTAADILFNAYGGGPRFVRDVINVGTPYVPAYQVAVYRVRVEAFLCNSAYPEPDSSSPSRHLVRFFAKNTSYRNAVDALIDAFEIKTMFNAVRCWINDGEDKSDSSSGMHMADMTIKRDSPSSGASAVTLDIMNRSEGMDAKRARIGRVLTSDVTDRSGAWKFMREECELNIRELQGDQDSVRLILEVASDRKPKPDDWPRRDILNRWKKSLRAGDVFDACDKVEGKWYAAVAKEVSANGDVSVHFKGWAARFDEVIPASRVATCIEPLYTHTKDRREWAVGDEVDHRVTPPDGTKPVWIEAKITAVDPATDRVEVSFLLSEKEAALRKFLKDSPPTLPAVCDDDAAKRLGTAPLPASAPIIPVSLADIDESPAPPSEVTVWCDLLGEDICPLRTHTKPRSSTGGRTTGTSLMEPTTPTSSYSSTFSSAMSYITKPFQSAAGRFDYSEKHVKGTTEVAGAVGLQNLGNTCFMNSILQCVSNTEAITRLFLNDAYKTQLNTDNPLGHGGKLAVAYAKLIKDMWSNAYCKIIPRDFKHTIGEFQPQFAGYDQQDSQEFLGFLLDGLHEDLNRVVKKPHVTKIESKGRPDVVIASESWRRYLLRNDSELVDRCFGQLKSHVTCTNCGNESVTFDEYSSLSLPLPVRNSRPVTLIVQLLPLSSLPVKVELDVEVTTTMKQLPKLLTDKLIALKLLPASGLTRALESTLSTGQTSPADSADESAAPAAMEVEDGSRTSRTCTTTASKTSSPHGGDEYESFEMVSRPRKDGIAAEGVSSGSDAAYVTVHSEDRMDDSHTSASVTPVPCPSEDLASDTEGDAVARSLPTSTSPIAAAHTTGPHFHFGTLFSSRPSSVFKHYNAAEHGATAVHSFIQRHDSLMAFQLEHWALEVRTVSYHSTYSRAPPTQYDPADADCGYVAVDLCMGSKVTSAYNNYERIELGGYPYRLSLPEGCTNTYVHKKVWELSRRYLKEDSPHCDATLQTLPYTLAVTGSYSGAGAKRTIEVNDEVFVPPASGSDVLVVVWPSTYEQDVDDSQINAVRDAPEDASAGRSKGGPLNIYQCFDKFIEREQLAEAETLYCSRCKQHLAPIKKMDLWAAPDILVVQLKRFQYIPGQYFVHREKISDVVDFPVEGLDLTRYVIGPQHPEAPPVYDLYAVSQHMGGLGGGHYTATCKNFMNGKWYDFNDSHVSGTEPERAVNGSAYVLFYKRRTGSLKWGGIVPSAVPMPDEEK